MLISRIYAILGISTMTGIMCFQEMTKKGIVLTNFTRSMVHSDEPVTEIIKSKAIKVNEKVESLKERGNGSVVNGLKNEYVRNQFDEEGNKRSAKENAKIIVKNLKNEKLSEVGPEVVQIELVPEKKTFSEKIANIRNMFRQESFLKSEKLIQDHMQFASLALFGSLFMPVTFFSLALGYTVAYEFYYFSSSSDNKGLVDFQQFTPIWRAFMLGGIGIFGFKMFKKAKKMI